MQLRRKQLTSKRKVSHHPQIFWTTFYKFEKFSWFYMTIKLLCVLGIIRAMYSFVVWFVKGIKELSDRALPSLPSLGSLYAPFFILCLSDLPLPPALPWTTSSFLETDPQHEANLARSLSTNEEPIYQVCKQEHDRLRTERKYNQRKRTGIGTRVYCTRVRPCYHKWATISSGNNA